MGSSFGRRFPGPAGGNSKAQVAGDGAPLTSDLTVPPAGTGPAEVTLTQKAGSQPNRLVVLPPATIVDRPTEGASVEVAIGVDPAKARSPRRRWMPWAGCSMQSYSSMTHGDIGRWSAAWGELVLRAPEACVPRWSRIRRATVQRLRLSAADWTPRVDMSVDNSAGCRCVGARRLAASSRLGDGPTRPGARRR